MSTAHEKSLKTFILTQTTIICSYNLDRGEDYIKRTLRNTITAGDEMSNMTDLVTILSRWTLGSSRPRQTNRSLNSITTSWTLRAFLTLEKNKVCWNGVLKECASRIKKLQGRKILTGAPFSPAGPGGPWGPGLPDSPIGPAGPAGPLSPGEPCVRQKDRHKKEEGRFVYPEEKYTYFRVLPLMDPNTYIHKPFLEEYWENSRSNTQ